jgi:anaerobic selenocysteine-containing dehydrogenase
VTDGAPVTVSGAHGAVTAPARVDERLRPGTVCVPHGFVAANPTRLSAGDDVDPLTGMPVMTGVPVSVATAR